MFETSSSTPLWSYTSSGHIYKLDMSYNGSYIVSGGQEGKIRLHHKDSNTPLATKSASDINDVVISDDGLYYAAGSDDSKLRLYQRGSSSSWIDTLGDDVTELAMTSDGQYLAVSVRDGKVHFYEVSNLNEKWSFDTGEESWAIGISDDANKIVVGNQDNEIELNIVGRGLPNNIVTIIIWSYCYNVVP